MAKKDALNAPIDDDDLPIAHEIVPAIHPGHPDVEIAERYDAWRLAARGTSDPRWPSRPPTEAQRTAEAEAKRALLDMPATTAAGVLLKLHHLRFDYAFEHTESEELAPLFADLERIAGQPGPLPSPAVQGKVFSLAQRIAALHRAHKKADEMQIAYCKYQGKQPGMEALAEHFMGLAERDLLRLADEIIETPATTAEEALIIVGLLLCKLNEFHEDIESDPQSLEPYEKLVDTLDRALPNAVAGLRRGLGRRFSDLGVEYFCGV